MRGIAYHQRPRSLGAQKARMAALWPNFSSAVVRGSVVRWVGRLRGFQKWYVVAVLWNSKSEEKPYVYLCDPPLRPRENTTFEEIPHLLYFDKNPELSGLCLFDPAGQEWSNWKLIADTTLPWAGEWLQYYELWHVDGVWRGGGVGPESIAEARAATLYQKTAELATDPS